MNRRQRTLARKVKRQARREYRAGNIDRSKFESAIAVANSGVAMVELEARIDEHKLDPWKNPERLIGADWREMLSNLWDWFVENWPAILKIILTIAPLLILEPKNED